jgi:hypothetical protein
MAENSTREFTQKATEYSERAKRAANETTKVMEQSYAAASKGALDFHTKFIDIA